MPYPAKWSQYFKRALGRRTNAVPAASGDEDWLALGLEAMRALDFERALTCFDEAVNAQPKIGRAHV